VTSAAATATSPNFVLRGLVGTILTTNFDICLPRALNDKRPHIRHVAEVNRGPDDFREFDIFNRAQIVWLHGKAEQYTDKNLAEEVANLDPKLVGALLPLLQSTPLIVVGYRGAEPSIMTSLLGESGDLAFDAPGRGRLLRSSDEAGVMPVERRERAIAIWLGSTGNGRNPMSNGGR
jgi:hypothetical protein